MKITKTLSILSIGLAVLCSTANADGDKSEKTDKAAKMHQAQQKKAEALVAKYDANGDGKLSAEELTTAMSEKAISIRGEKKPKQEKAKETEHESEE